MLAARMPRTLSRNQETLQSKGNSTNQCCVRLPGRLQQNFRGEPKKLYWRETNSEESNTTMSEMDFKPEL